MERTMVTIWILALALILCSANVSEAAPMGTAFTYQGFLYDANSPADDIYDFEFTLYDANETGSQVAGPIDVNDVDVLGGVFTVEIDFGSDVFDGNDVWLEIGVRPGDSGGGFTTLSPRQEITPVPYALQTRGIFVDNAGNIGIGTASPLQPLHIARADMASLFVHETGSNVIAQIQADGSSVSVQAIYNHPLRFSINDIERLYIDTTGNVGIGTTSPGTKLHVYEPSPSDVFMSVEASSSNAEAGVRLTNPAGGWDVFANDEDGDFGISYALSDRVLTIKQTTGNVGVGTESPTATVDVNGFLGLEIGPPINEISTDGTLGDNSDDALPTEKAVKTYVDNQVSAGSVGVVPVGGVVAWLKSFPNTPVLSDNFVECNGQTLSDLDSPFDGQTIPNLNGDSGGTQRFLRGSTISGTTGGSETHNHTLDSIGSSPSMGPYSIGELTTNSTSTLPSYYEVVWIMRVK